MVCPSSRVPQAPRERVPLLAYATVIATLHLLGWGLCLARARTHPALPGLGLAAYLLRERFIALQRPSAVRALLEQTLAERRVELRVAFECHQLATVGRMVAQGLGVSAVPGFCVPQMAELGARCRPLVSPGVQRRIGLLRRTDRQLSSAAQALCDLLLRIEDWESEPTEAGDGLVLPDAP